MNSCPCALETLKSPLIFMMTITPNNLKTVSMTKAINKIIDRNQTVAQNIINLENDMAYSFNPPS